MTEKEEPHANYLVVEETSYNFDGHVCETVEVFSFEKKEFRSISFLCSRDTKHNHEIKE